MTNEHSACFVVPFWRTDKDDKCVKNFIESAQMFDMSQYLYFIIDSEEDRNFLLDIDRSLKTFLVNEDISKNNMNVPTAKKFYGLEVLYDKYEYIAAIDCDSIFLKNFDIYEVFNEIWESKSCFYKARQISEGSVEGRRKCAEEIGLANNYFLKRETEDFLYNIWFNDIPVYKSSNLKEFFDWIHFSKLEDGNTIYNHILQTFECFDYFIYWYWLVSYKGFTSDRTYFVSNNVSLIESIPLYYKLSIDMKNKIPEEMNYNLLYMIYNIEETIKTHWTTRNYEKTKKIIPNSRLCMQIHCDRLGC